MRLGCRTCLLTASLAGALLAADVTSPLSRPDIQKARPWTEPRAPVSRVLIINLEGDVTYGLAASIRRRTEEARALTPPPDLIIFRIDTYGGTADSALDIAKVIGDVETPTTVAYIPEKAISAGALIAMSCREMVMGRGAKIGDCQPIIPTAEGMTPAGEKVETMLRASFRAFAERNGYPEALAEAMVSSHLEVHKVTIAGEVNPRYVRAEKAAALKQEFADKVLADEVVVPKGDLLTMVANEAFEYGFARAIVTGQEGLLAYYGATQAEVLQEYPSWSEEMVRFLDLIGPLLLAAGLLGLYLEFKTPGFGLPGIVGIACLVLYFGSKYLVGLADVVDILLFFIGVVLVGVEVFVIPGFGIVGVTGILLILAGLFLSVQPGPFVIPRTPAEAQALASGFLQLLVAFVVVLAAAFLLGRYLPHIPVVSGLVLTTEPVGAKVFASAAPTEQKLGKLVGARGVATTLCRPAGKAVFGNELVDVVAQAEYIRRGQGVEVLAVEGNRVIVRPLPLLAAPSGEEA